tara:strand:+ start:193 stop:510 length:318 start_codon:yes stop_codon:yes gene_type:complete
MAIRITQKDDKKLTLSGTSTELNSVYARLEIALFPDGTSANAGLHVYDSKSSYTAGKRTARVDDLILSRRVELEEGVEQTLSSVHDAVKELIKADGYTATVVDLS